VCLSFFSPAGADLTLSGGYLGPASALACAADLNSDSEVDDSDFVLFAAAYDTLECTSPSMPQDCPADLDGNSFVDDADFVLFAHAYDELVCP